MNHKPRQRRPSRAESRATEWVRRTSRRAIRNGEGADANGRVQHTAAYIVSRAVQDGTPGGIFDRPDILDFLDSDHGAKTVRSIKLSLISPKTGKALINRWANEPDNLRRQLEEVTEDFPDSLGGFLSTAMIFGASKQHTGPRFIGYTLNRPLQSTIEAEHRQLITATAQTLPRRHNYKPHITLLETTDQKLAEDLAGALGNLLRFGVVPLELGPAEVVPVANVHNRYHDVG